MKNEANMMKKILIVDDHADVIESLQKIVKKMGYTSSSAHNGEEFLKKVKVYNPDLVLLDVMMPGLTTKEILAELKRMKLTKTKIILLTVVRFADDEIAELKSKSNVIDYITKPFGVDDLMVRIKKNI